MKYSNLIDDMRWSYSRIKSYEMCPYMFYLAYIRHEDKKPMFFSDFGSFVHHILELYLKGLMTKEELAAYYLERFSDAVIGHAPDDKIYASYLRAGLDYLKSFDFPFKNIKKVEWKSEFSLKGNGKSYPFVGIIDCVADDNGELCIVDHKSHNLKPRSKRKKPTKGDEELDEYLRQLYLYSIIAYEEYGRYPDYLVFNCFRTKTVIKEPFKEEKFKEAVQWAVDTIQKIREEDEWNPDMDYWQCKYICDLHDSCDYYQLNRR